MAKLLSQTELSRAQGEYGADAIENINGQSYLKSGYALGGLADPVAPPTPTTPIPGSPDAQAQANAGTLNTPSNTTGLDTNLINQYLSGILTSQSGNADITKTKDYLDKVATAQTMNQQQQDELTKRNQQQIDRIEQIYKERQAEMEKQFKQQRGTEAAVQFRLGQSGTPYALEEAKLNEEKRQAELNALTSEKTYLIQQAQNAYTDADFKLASQLTDQIQGIEDKQREINRQAQQDQIQMFNVLLNASNEDRAQKQFAAEQAQNIENQNITKQNNAISRLNTLLTENIPLDSISTTSKSEIENALGLQPGTFDTSYQQALENKSSDNLSTSYQIIGGKLKLMNDQTGETIKDLGPVTTKESTSFSKIGVDENGNDVYGFVNTSDQIITPYNAPSVEDGYITSSTGSTYDIGNYAKKEGNVAQVQKLLKDIGQFNTPEDITNYIQSVQPNSPITADMIQTASEQSGVDWETLVAMLQNESNLGTSPVAQKNNNVGGITWTGSNGTKGTARPADEGGYYVKYPTMQEGINVVAQNLANRQIPNTGTPITADNLIDVNGVDYVLRPDGTLELPQLPAGAGQEIEKDISGQLAFLKSAIKSAKELSGAAGPSFITEKLGDTFVGDTKFRRLETFTNTLQTNILTMVADPDIKKFFGPQMTEKDVELMVSAGTTLNPKSNSPSELKAELIRLEKMFDRLESGIPNNTTTDKKTDKELEEEYNTIYLPANN